MFIGNGELGIDYLSVFIYTQFGLVLKEFYNNYFLIQGEFIVSHRRFRF